MFRTLLLSEYNSALLCRSRLWRDFAAL